MKKKLAIALALVLLCTLAVSNTLTYFQATTDVKTNTMTVGNVKIEQIEEFADKTSLRPYIGNPNETATKFDPALNAVTKTVTVKNTGTEAAFIRTLFAFEAVNGADPVASASPIIHVNYNTDTNVGTWASIGSVTVDGALYYVYSFTYTAAVAGNNNATEASLKAIALDCKQDNKFFEAVGAEYNVLVLSQAVQSTGFADAAAAFTAAFPLGENSANLADWFN